MFQYRFFRNLGDKSTKSGRVMSGRGVPLVCYHEGRLITIELLSGDSGCNSQVRGTVVLPSMNRLLDFRVIMTFRRSTS